MITLPDNLEVFEGECAVPMNYDQACRKPTSTTCESCGAVACQDCVRWLPDSTDDGRFKKVCSWCALHDSDTTRFGFWEWKGEIAREDFWEKVGPDEKRIPREVLSDLYVQCVTEELAYDPNEGADEPTIAEQMLNGDMDENGEYIV